MPDFFLTAMHLEGGAAERSNLRTQVLPHRLSALIPRMLSHLQYQPCGEPRALKGYQTPRQGASRIKGNGELNVQKQDPAMTLVTPQAARLNCDQPQRQKHQHQQGVESYLSEPSSEETESHYYSFCDFDPTKHLKELMDVKMNIGDRLGAKGSGNPQPQDGVSKGQGAGSPFHLRMGQIPYPASVLSVDVSCRGENPFHSLESQQHGTHHSTKSKTNVYLKSNMWVPKFYQCMFIS